MKQINPEKSQSKYVCIKCEYSTCSNKDYNKHLSTRKHRNVTSETNKSLLLSCEQCNKLFTNRTSLWRHKKKHMDIHTYIDLDNENVNENVNENDNDKSEPSIVSMFADMITQNKELQKMLLVQQEKHQEEIHQFQEETHKQMLELANESNKVIYNNNNTNNNTINNRFNMNFFLNEQCKDAMNLTDFLNNIEVSLEDVSNVGRLGYADGISRIIINALKDMDVYERPIHCSDIKREIMYIKDNDIWEKDDERKYQMKRVLKLISHKNVKRLLDWREAHPGWLVYDSKEEAECLRITNESMGGASDEENERLYKKMIRRIAHETLIDKKLVE